MTFDHMDLDREIPFKVCFHQPRREDRRRQASEMFRMHGLRVTRAMDMHAVAIRACWFDTLLRRLRPSALEQTGPFDVL
ncbi:MAG: hypothetical protein EOP86_24210, partial [Verrucomicrobiaceae bacterium]